VVHRGAQCHQTGADGRQDAHQIRVSATGRSPGAPCRLSAPRLSGRYKTDKPVAKKRDKTKKRAPPKKQSTGADPGAAAEPTKSMDLRTRMTNCFTEVCVESANLQFNFLILKPQEL
jgi:hypothetical protein